jgi:hypothetical protein
VGLSGGGGGGGGRARARARAAGAAAGGSIPRPCDPAEAAATEHGDAVTATWCYCRGPPQKPGSRAETAWASLGVTRPRLVAAATRYGGFKGRAAAGRGRG